jgi:SP family myo-inositol transporter-like MFS transporter 13
MLLLGRLIVGFAVGANSGLVPLYVYEVSPKNLKGVTGSLNQVLISSGGLVAFYLGFYVDYTFPGEPNFGNIWRLMFALPGIVSMVRMLLLTSVFTFETPKYLM